MKNIYCGEIIEFEQTASVDIVEVVYREREQLPTTYRYYVDPICNRTIHASNHIFHTFESSKLVVNYIRKVKCRDKSGLLRFREFNQVEIEKNVIVDYNVYEVNSPFTLEEYYDGTFLFLIFHDLKLDVAVSTNGLVYKMSSNVFKCKFQSGDKDVMISGKQFVINFTPLSLNDMDDLNLKITTRQDCLLLSLRVNQNIESSLLNKYTNTGDESYTELLDVYNTLQETHINYNFDLSRDLEKEFSKCNIEGVKSLRDNKINEREEIQAEDLKRPLKYFRIENGLFKIKEEAFDKNYSFEGGNLRIKVKLTQETHEHFSLNQEGITIELRDYFLWVNDCKFRILIM